MKTVLPLALAVAALAAAAPAQEHGVGYDDTPFLPGGRWRVHDKDRPVPPVVTPGAGAGLGTAPPADAIVLYDGHGFAAWDKEWREVEGGAMEVRGGDIRSRRAFADCQLHLEWRAPVMAERSSQGKGNSGVFLMDRYEIQVLDSWRNRTYADGQAAAIYGQKPPDVNACRPPGEWQSYDIVFTAPRFAADGSLTAPAVVTVFHNGVLVHDHVPLLGATVHRALPSYQAHGPAPLRLQDHGDPVQYRNVWIRPLGGAGAPEAAGGR
ncbi:MAG: DUF1080 domain-containing protein [Planctomycetota bacterium]|nr:MAG: DUF1080 domain-containing protein [Planctomycetota bacterium]